MMTSSSLFTSWWIGNEMRRRQKSTLEITFTPALSYPGQDGQSWQSHAFILSLFTRARILISHTADTRTSSVYLQFVYNLVVFCFCFVFVSFFLFFSLSLTWLKYSSAIRRAHSMHMLRGRVGLETSAHLISIRLTRMMFSWVLRLV